MNTFAEFVLWEASSRDTIDFKKVYVDVAGDLLAGLMLSEIVYWYLPTIDGSPNKLRVTHDGYEWIAVRRYEWWDRVRMSPREADRALAILVKAGLVTKALYKFSGETTAHVRLLEQPFMDRLNAAQNSPATNPHLPINSSRNLRKRETGLLDSVNPSNKDSFKDSEKRQTTRLDSQEPKSIATAPAVGLSAFEPMKESETQTTPSTAVLEDSSGEQDDHTDPRSKELPADPNESSVRPSPQVSPRPPSKETAAAQALSDLSLSRAVGAYLRGGGLVEDWHIDMAVKLLGYAEELDAGIDAGCWSEADIGNLTREKVKKNPAYKFKFLIADLPGFVARRTATAGNKFSGAQNWDRVEYRPFGWDDEPDDDEPTSFTPEEQARILRADRERIFGTAQAATPIFAESLSA